MRQNEGTALNHDETMAVAILSEVARCLSQGKPIDLHFKPLANQADKHTLVLCQWMVSGRLKVKQEGVSKKYKHADTIEDALDRKRCFTVTKELFRELPQRKPRS